MNTIQTSTVRAGDGAELCVQTFGERGDPAMLLIGAATWSMDWWEDDLCHRLAEVGHRVIRYDARDTGASTSYPAGEPGYGGSELASDAVAVLDSLGVDRAHVVGLSMGGGIAQRLALEHRGRVATLTLIATTPIHPGIEDLPAPTEQVMATFTEQAPEPDWTDRDAVVDHIVEGERPYAGPGNFDEPGLRDLAGRVFDRTRDMAASMTNHFILSDDVPSDLRLDALTGVPTLVLHGTADPMFPLPHGRALAASIPGARLIELVDVGHQLPPRHTWDVVVEAVGEHTASA